MDKRLLRIGAITIASGTLLAIGCSLVVEFDEAKIPVPTDGGQDVQNDVIPPPPDVLDDVVEEVSLDADDDAAETNGDAPAETAPDAPVETAPDAPAETTPDAPVETAPDAPADADDALLDVPDLGLDI